MAMRTIFIFSAFLFAPSLFAQQGFKKTYSGATTGASFVDILWDGEKLITTGQFLTDTAPNGALNGLLYMELDTNGNTLHTDIYFEPNDAIASDLGNSIGMDSEGKVFVLTQAVDDTGALINIYKGGELLNTQKVKFTGLESWLYYYTEKSNTRLLTGFFTNLQYDWEGFLIKVDKNGQEVWRKYYGFTNLNVGLGKPYVRDNNTWILPAGKLHWPSIGPITSKWLKTWIVTVDSLGNIKSQWESAKNVESGIGNSLIQLTNGNWLYLTSEFIPIPGQIDDWGLKPKIVCRDSSFNLVWERYLSNFISKTNYAIDLAPTPDGNYVAIGRWDYYTTTVIHKFAPNGDSIWSYYDDCSPALACDNKLGGVVVLPSGSVFAAGYSEDYDINKSFGVLIKLNKNGCLDTLTCGGGIGTAEADIVNRIKIYPNPTADKISIENPIGETVSLFDIEGRIVMKGDVLGSSHSMDLTSLKPGIYLLKMEDKKLNLTYKIIKK